MPRKTFTTEQIINKLRKAEVMVSHRETVAEGRRLLLEWLVRTTRIVTSHPAYKERLTGIGCQGTWHYPLCGDGRAPRSLQPIHREDVNTNYI